MECGNDDASVHFCMDCADELCVACRVESEYGPVRKWGYIGGGGTKIPPGPVDG
jgi:hypothetical protein